LAQAQQESCTPFKATAHRLDDKIVRVVFEPLHLATVASAHITYGKATDMEDHGQFTHVQEMHYVKLHDADIFTADIDETPEADDTLVFRIKFDQVLSNGQVLSCISKVNTAHLGGERAEEFSEVESERGGGRGHWGGGFGGRRGGHGWGRGYGAEYGIPYGYPVPEPYPVPVNPSDGGAIYPPVVPVNPTGSSFGCPMGTAMNQLGQCVLVNVGGIPMGTEMQGGGNFGMNTGMGMGMQQTGAYFCPSNYQYDAASHTCIAPISERLMAQQNWNPNQGYSNQFSQQERITAQSPNAYQNQFTQQNQQELLQMLANNQQQQGQQQWY